MYYLSTLINDCALANEKGNVPFYGLLIGIDERRWTGGGTVDIFNVVFISEPLACDALRDGAFALQRVLPANFDIVGVVRFTDSEQEKKLDDIGGYLGDGLIQELNSESFIVLSMPFATLTSPVIFDKPLGEVHLVDPESLRLVDQGGDRLLWKRFSEMASNRVTVRLRMSIPWSFNCQETWSADEMEQEIRRYFDRRLSNLFVDKSWFIGFRNSEKTMLMVEMSDDQPQIVGCNNKDMTLLDLYGKLTTVSKRKALCFHQDVIDGSFLEKTTESNTDNARNNGMDIVPIIQYEAGDFLHISIPQIIETVVICGQECKISSLPSLVLESFRRLTQLRLQQFLKYSDLKKKRLCVLEPHLFLPHRCGHFVVNYFPAGYSNEQLEPERRELHSHLGLPTNRPLFRTCNVFCFPLERGPYLVDIHQWVADPGIKASITGIVSGHYEYHHYMQDHFDDKNWGCAYRSFQTIWSWFLLNGYTEKPVPSHREIQQALVDVGDREPNFVGSRQWIGSLELSYCLSHLADVTSKILSVTTGDEMSQKARELIHHFRTEGTPVMIGGGVLAHTILGVAYHEDTGEAKFLVLDPHYTGDENVQTIIDKGWCGWKPVTFWDKNAFYNMMLPMRPNMF